MTHEEELRRLLNDAATEIPAGNAPIAELVREGRRSKSRRHIVQAASVAAAVAVIAVGAFIVGPSIGGGGNLAARPTTSPIGLAVPPGTRLVGMNGVAVAVPEDWGTNQIDDETCDVLLDNTVVFTKPAIGTLLSTPCLSLRERWSSLHWFPADDEQIAEAIGDYEPAGHVGGVAIFRKEIVGPILCQQKTAGDTKVKCLPKRFNGALIVPSKNVLMYGNSPRKATIEEILGSVRLIPEGYTAVPDLSGLTSDSEVQPLVENARLLWEHRCPDGYVCDMDPIEATDPAAGSVVPVGTTVRAVDEPERKSDTTDDDRSLTPVGEIPGESELLGQWRASGELARQLKSAGYPERSLVLNFNQSSQKFWWNGFEICNRTGGWFKVGADGVFSTFNDASTRIACGEDANAVTVPSVVVEATQVRLVAGQLRLFDEEGSLLGTFERLETPLQKAPASVEAKRLSRYPLESFVDGAAIEAVDAPPLNGCGHRVWPPSGEVQQRTVRSVSVQPLQVRQVLLFPDEESAQETLNAVRDAFETCPVEWAVDDGSAISHTITLPGWGTAPLADVGDFSLAISLRRVYQHNRELERTEVRWIRLDNAVIYTVDDSQQSADLGQLSRQADETSRLMTDSWCQLAVCD